MSWMSASCGAGRVPDAVIFVSSVTEATAAADGGNVVGAVDGHGEGTGQGHALAVGDAVGQRIGQRFALAEACMEGRLLYSV